jgi:hypothetical protein
MLEQELDDPALPKSTAASAVTTSRTAPGAAFDFGKYYANAPPPSSMSTTAEEEAYLQQTLAESDEDEAGIDAMGGFDSTSKVPHLKPALDDVDKPIEELFDAQAFHHETLPEEKKTLTIFELAEKVEKEATQLGDRRVLAPLRNARAASSVGYASGSGNVMRLEPLQALHKQIVQFKARAGAPTVIHAHLKFIAIGTDEGLVLVFDHFENFGKPALDSRRYGAVTALDVAGDGNLMIVGHQNGTIVVWDLSKRQAPLKAIEDASTLPIVSLFFLPGVDKSWFVSANTTGRVELWTLTKLLFTYMTDRQCLLDGAGAPGQPGSMPVLASAALFPTPRYPHICDRFTLIALATEEKIMLVSLTPAVKIVWRKPRVPSARVGVVPALAWRQLQLHEKPGTVGLPETKQAPVPTPGVGKPSSELSRREAALPLHPVLAYARGLTVFLLAAAPLAGIPADDLEPVTKGSDFPVGFQRLGNYEASTEVVHVAWLLGQLLIVLTADGGISVVDPYALTCLEKASIRTLGLCSHSLFANPESKLAEPCYHLSIGTSGNGMTLLGSQGVLSAKALTWSERITNLENAERVVDALALSMDFFDGIITAPGLSRDVRRRQEDLESRMVALLNRYVDLIFSPSLSARSPDSRDRELKIVGGISMDFCASLQRMDILYGVVFAKYQHVGADKVFLELLEPYVMTGQLKQVSPVVLSQLFARAAALSPLLSARAMAVAEQLLLRLNVDENDASAVLTLCRDYFVLGGLFHVHTRTLGDYQAPVAEAIALFQKRFDGTQKRARALARLETSNDPESSSSISNEHLAREAGEDQPVANEAVVRKIMLYIQWTLAGKAFPSGLKLPSSFRELLKAQMRTLLFSPLPKEGASTAPSDSQKPLVHDYPWLLFLLKHHAAETLHLLEAFFADPDPTDHHADSAHRGSDIAPDPVSYQTISGGAAIAGPSLLGSAGLGAAALAISTNSASNPASTPGAALGASSSTSEDLLNRASGFLSSVSSLISNATTAIPTNSSTPLSVPSGTNTSNVVVLSSGAIPTTAPAPPSEPEVDEAELKARKEPLAVRALPSYQQMFDVLTVLFAGSSNPTEESAVILSYPIVDANGDTEDLLNFACPVINPTPQALSQFYHFGATVIANKKVVGSRDFVLNVCAHLCVVDTSSASERRQKQTALLALLKATPISKLRPGDGSLMLSQARAALFFDLAVYILNHVMEHPDLKETLDVFVKAALSPENSTTSAELFSWLDGAVAPSEANEDSVPLLELRQTVLARAHELVELDAALAVQLILNRFRAHSEQVVSKLSAFPQLQLAYLQRLSEGGSRDGAEAIYAGAESEESKLSAPLCQLYIELLCEFQPHKVYDSLKTSQNYDVEKALAVARKFKVHDAAAYLLERTGDVDGALALMLDALTDAGQQLLHHLFTLGGNKVMGKHVPGATDASGKGTSVMLKELELAWLRRTAPAKRLERLLHTSMEVCQRAIQSEGLWLTLLDKCLSEKARVKTVLAQALKCRGPQEARGIFLVQELVLTCLHIVLQKMMAEVPLQTILARITQTPGGDQKKEPRKAVGSQARSGSSGEWREFQPAIEAMFDAYAYEQNIYRTAKELVSSGTFALVDASASLKKPPLTLRDETCIRCHLALNRFEVAKVTVFSCGHAVHDTCVVDGSEEIDICPARACRAAGESKKLTSRGLQKVPERRTTMMWKAGPKANAKNENAKPRNIVGPKFNLNSEENVGLLSAEKDKLEADEKHFAQKKLLNTKARQAASVKDMAARLVQTQRALDRGGLAAFDKKVSSLDGASSKSIDRVAAVQQVTRNLLTLAPVYADDNKRPGLEVLVTTLVPEPAPVPSSSVALAPKKKGLLGKKN